MRDSFELSRRKRPWSTEATHTKYSRYVCPKSWRKLAFSRKEMCAVRPACPKAASWQLTAAPRTLKGRPSQPDAAGA